VLSVVVGGLPAGAEMTGPPTLNLADEDDVGLVEGLRRLLGVGGDRQDGPGLPGDVDLGVEAVPRDEPALEGVRWPEPVRVAELTGRRSANASFFQLADGRVQAEISAAPVNYRDGQGVFRPIDTRVGETSRSGFVKGNTTNSFTSLFGDDTERLVRFEADGRHVELGLAGPARPVEPVVDGSRVVYAGVAGGGDLVYEVSPRELREKIVLAGPPAGGGFLVEFTVKTGGVDAVARPDGSIGFVPAAGGEPVFVIPAPYMYDSAGDPGSPVGFGYSDRVSQSVRQRGSTATITVVADAGWLADPARVYPVTIDPTIRVVPVPTDAQDVQIYSGDTGRNYNDTYQLKVGTDATAAWRSLVRFPLTGVPAGTQVDDAQLQLFYDQTHTTWEHDVSMLALRVSQPWSESSATWANMAANTGAQPVGNSVTLDDGSTGTSVSGTWPFSANPDLTPLAVKGDYRFNSDATTGNTHTWVPTLTEAGDYQVDVHFVSESDRPGNAPYTVFYAGGSKTYSVDQTGAPAGRWKTLGVHPFTAGTTGRVVLGDVAGKAVIADAVRFTKWGVASKKRAVSSVWHSFPVRNVVQEWIDGTHPNHGFMLKALNETTKGRGGPIYEASEFAYQNDRRDYNLPRLVLTFGRVGTSVNPPTTITATGAALSWPAYADPTGANGAGDDIVEYQVHRSVLQTYTPSAATLVAPVGKTALAYQDSSATPTPTDEDDPLKQNFFYYMVAVKTADGQVIPGPTQGVLLPKAGQIRKIFRETTSNQVPDTTLAAARPTENVNVYDGDPYVSPGNNSTFYGDTRGLVKFANLTGIPAGAQVVDAQLRMWNTSLFPGTDTDEWVDVYRVTRAWAETGASWSKANSTTSWTNPGGDFATPALSGFNGFTNDPEWEHWHVTAAVKTWLATPSSNHGLLLRQRDEANATARAMLLSSEAAEPLLRPTLEVTYLEPTPASTYHAPASPDLVTPATGYTTPVTISNPTLTTWTTAGWELSYHWTRPDGIEVSNPSNQVATALPEDISPGETVDISAQLSTPAPSAEGNKRADYLLQWELRNKSTGQWLSDITGIAPLEQRTAVEEPTSDQIGLEKFYSYTGVNTGAGSAVVNNLHAGNAVWSYDAFVNPSRGLSTFVRLAYNSLDTSDAGSGYGWSVQASSLIRLGTPLDFHPNPNPTTITLTDGDGTSHKFAWDAGTGAWTHPKGVHLHLQQQAVCGPNSEQSRAWVMTKPDRTQFFYDCDGYLSSIEDNNGNLMSFTYEVRRSQNKPTKFLAYITDPTGRQTLTLDYWNKGDTYDIIDDTTWTKITGQANLTNPHIIDHLRTITDISGRELRFTYTDKGLLGELVDGAGTPQPKTFAFAYDMTQGNNNVKLVRITDPRGNHTGLDYYDLPEDDPQFHWRAKTITDRLSNPTSFAYTDPDGPQGQAINTAVTDPEGNASSQLSDGFGRPTQTTNALSQTTTLGWDGDHNVVSLQEPNGAVSTWVYDPKTGYPTQIKDPEAVANATGGTTLAYQTGLGGHIADLIAKQSPQGRRWTFGYTLEGDLATVTDPLGNTTSDPDDFTTGYTYDTFGQLLTATDPNGNTTVFAAFHPTGYPELITDPLGGTVETVYDPRGNVLSVTDQLDATTTVDYDVFGRPLEMVTPLDADAGEFITTPAPVYDPNDNITMATAPNGAATSTAYDAADRPVEITLPENTPGGPPRVATVAYDRVGNVVSQTEPLGNLTPSDPDDHVTSYAYDQIYQLSAVTDAEGNQAGYQYDNVGNLVEQTDPRGNPTGYAYDRNHRLVTLTDAAGQTTHTEYDLDSLLTATIDQAGVRTETVYDQRGMVAEMRTPHRDGSTRITRYEYDQAGNTLKVTSPRGTATAAEPDDFAQQTVYDALNRPVEQRLPYDPGDPAFDSPDRIFYEYDPAGRVTKVSAPPSAGQSIRNNTVTEYLDTGWVQTTTDPLGIVTGYDYNQLGQQTGRTLTSAGGSSGRTMTWDYFLDGSLAARSDDGVPAGLHVVLVDNSDQQNVELAGTWTNGDTGQGLFGFDYATSAAGTGTDSAKWALNIPADGAYQAFARWPQVTGAASDATYTVVHDGGSTPAVVDQSQQAGQWVSLGSYTFTEGGDASITLTDDAGGTVVADAVKLVRDTTGQADTEAKDLTYTYDVNGNLIGILDNSSDATVDSYTVGYDGLNRVAQIEELAEGLVANTTSFTYNQVGAPLTRTHDDSFASFTYDARNLLATVTNGETATDPDLDLTTYTYTPRGQQATQTKANGNTVAFDYWPDGALREQVETKPDATVVASHLYEYDLNGNRGLDTTRQMNADDHGSYLERVSSFGYDPRDRLAQVTRTDPATSAQVGSETYTHDANNNIITQTIDGVTTTSVYDRNRLQTTTIDGVTSAYNYDPFGRLNTITTAGQTTQRYLYDGFDRIIEQHTDGILTQKSYDPLDRLATETTDAGGPDEETTLFTYLGLTEQVLTEQIGGQVTTSYQHSLAGQLLSQTKHDTTGTGVDEDSFYAYNPHGDVAAITNEAGDTRATYGYTAYGSDDESLFTGVDKPDPIDPTTQEPYNVHRYAGKRFDTATGTYDMGFRDYSPGLNRFLTRDMYNGALADLNLGSNPWNMSRYTFAGGNPTTLVEYDGHAAVRDIVGGGASPPTDACGGREPFDMPSCAPSRPTAGIFLGPDLVVAPNEEELSTAIQAEVDHWCNNPGFWEKVLGGAGVEGCVLDEPSEMLENNVRANICADHPDWCELQDVSDVTLIAGVAGVGYSAFGRSGRPPHSAVVNVFDADGNQILRQHLRSGNMTAAERALGFPNAQLATHTERRAMLLPVPKGGHFLVIEGQYSPCSRCKFAMRSAAESRNVVVAYRWDGKVWMATPQASGNSYRQLIQRMTRAR
jgi:RHS repeat-associated protein